MIDYLRVTQLLEDKFNLMVSIIFQNEVMHNHIKRKFTYIILYARPGSDCQDVANLDAINNLVFTHIQTSLKSGEH